MNSKFDQDKSQNLESFVFRATSLMILETEKHAYNDLAIDILNLDQGILSNIIVSNPEGSILARAAKSESQTEVGKLDENTAGMAAHWAILAFNLMKRLDTARSPAKYLSVGREDRQTLIFPVVLAGGSSPMIILVLRSHKEITDIYEKIVKLATKK